MMGNVSLRLLDHTWVGLILIGLLLPVAAHAAEQGWATVVESKSETMRRQIMSLPDAPPKPRAKPQAPAAVPAKAVPKPALVPAGKAGRPELIPVDEAEITTGTIGATNTPPMASPDDSARLFSQETAAPATSEITTGAVDGQGSDLARGYCVSISGSASDTRNAQQMAKLADMERQITQRIAALEAKTAEYKSWVERRDNILQRATSSLLKIYTQMEPESAALQLVSMEEETAASLLLKLEPASASAILNEMPPEKAARLAAGIAGAARIRPNPPAPPRAPPQQNPDAPERADPDGGR